MYNFLRNLFNRSSDDIYDTVARLNASEEGGPGRLSTENAGSLSIPSRSIILHDPHQIIEGLRIPHLASNRATFMIRLLRYPNGSATVASVQISFCDQSVGSAEKLVGEIGIDSAKMVLADSEAVRSHWTTIGADRIGVIATPADQKVHQALRKRFKLKTVQVYPWRAQTVEPVSEQLEREIEEFLESTPEFRSLAYMYFRIQTNSSFDRVIHMNAAWQFLPVGNDPEPIMFACGTGKGDGTYPVYASIQDGLVSSVRVTFIEAAN